MNMVLQREKHTVIKPFTTNYDETHPRMVDSLYSLLGFYHGFTMVFHMFSTCFPCVSMCSPHFFPPHLRGLLGLGLGLDPGRLSVDKLVAGEPDRILRLLEKG